MDSDEEAGWRSRVTWRQIFRETPVSQRLFLVLTVIFPLLMAGWYAGQARTTAIAEAEQEARRAAVALEEHATKVIETHILILAQFDTLLRQINDAAISEDPVIRRFFTDMTHAFQQVGTIGVTDAQGRLVASSGSDQPNATSAADRDFFLVHRHGTARGLHISQPFVGRLSNRPQFALSVPRTSPDGGFNGVIFTTVPLHYLYTFWKQFAPAEGYLVPLVREDGLVLARYPAQKNPERLAESGHFVTRLRTSNTGVYRAQSLVDGVDRINAYRRVGAYPLFISYSLETHPVLARWREEMLPTVVFSALASIALALYWLYVMRKAHEQRILACRWRDAAREIESEVHRREQAEDALRQSSKMEAIGRLAGGIAHDFNNLLAAIFANLDVVAIHLRHGRHEEAARHLGSAKSTAEKARALTSRLLVFSHRSPLTAKPVNVNRRIELIQELLSRSVGPSIEVRIALSPEAGNVCCDPAQFDTALLNLAINARDAMPAGGELVIATGAIIASDADEAARFGLEPGPYVRITVADSGSGMPAEVAAKAFDPFFTTKPAGEGTGLGLSMVYGFATQSGGRVRIQSRPGAGTQIHICLPAHAGQEVPDEVTRDAPLARAADALRILFVDDESLLRRPLAEVLRSLGYQVTEASHGAEALEILAGNAGFDLLVADVGLPGEIDGRRLASLAREKCGPGLQVLFITGYPVDDDAQSLPAPDVLAKPFTATAFAERIARLADRAARSTVGPGMASKQ